MLRAENELWGSVPDGHHDFIAPEQAALCEGLVPESRETQITDLDDAFRRHHDVCGLEITVEDEVGVEEVYTAEELV
jgi:hypothetical protein